MGDLQQGRIAIRPYDVRKHTHTMPMMFFVYLHICERPENTRVGAKSASWRSGVCDAIRPHSKFAHVTIRPHSKSPLG